MIVIESTTQQKAVCVIHLLVSVFTLTCHMHWIIFTIEELLQASNNLLFALHFAIYNLNCIKSCSIGIPKSQTNVLA